MTLLFVIIGFFFLTYGILHPIKALRIYLSVFSIAIIIFVVFALIWQYLGMLF